MISDDGRLDTVNSQHLSQMVLQISRTYDFDRKFMEKRCSLSASLYGKKENAQQHKDHAEDSENFDMIWQLRTRHLQKKTLPCKYLFYLLCYCQSDWVHPFCKEGKPNEEPCCFPGNSPFTYVPTPTLDPQQPFGNPNCSHCKEFRPLHEA